MVILLKTPHDTLFLYKVHQFFSTPIKSAGNLMSRMAII